MQSFCSASSAHTIQEVVRTAVNYNNTAWPRQKDLSDIAALSLSNYTIYIQSMSSNDTPEWAFTYTRRVW